MTDKPVLTVSKLGDWTGPMDKIAYPIQIIDAVRDVIVNILFRIFWVSKNDFIYYFDSFILPAVSDEKLMASFEKAGVTPTAWASRITRCKAIASAKSAVYIDAAVIACSLHLDDKDSNNKVFGPVLQQVNKAVGLKDKDGWDGILWPYDLLWAIATFMDNVTVKEGNGVHILLTSSKYNDKTGKGYADLVTANEFKQRIRCSLSTLAGYNGDDSAFDDWFNKRCTIKRITDDGSMMNHCKVICTDKQLLYIGSDNCYPNYNEEHGIWIDDQKTIDAWHKGYWSPRWNNFAKPATYNANSDDFPATMVKPGK
jgi:hypothetical protein